MSYDGTDFAVSGQTCAADQVVTGISAEGVLTCELDATGESYSGADFALASQSCTPGQVVVGISAAGAVLCASDANNVYSGAQFATSNQGCPGGQVSTGVSASGQLQCAPDNDTTYTGSDFAVSGQGCPAGQYVPSIAANGTITCSAPDTGDSGAPGGLAYGDGSAGNVTISTNTNWVTSNPPNHNWMFENLTINSGRTLTVPSGTVLRVSGTLTVNGTIEVAPGGQGYSGSHDHPAEHQNVYYGWGHTTPVSGPDEAVYTRALEPERLRTILHPGPCGGQPGDDGYNSANQDKPVLAGGAGGFIILASNNNITVSGTIQALGGNRGNGAPGGDDYGGGGGGGGGGGAVHHLSPNANSVPAASVPGATAAAGGGSGSGSGGAMGGDGGPAGDDTNAPRDALAGQAGVTLRTQVSNPGYLFY